MDGGLHGLAVRRRVVALHPEEPPRIETVRIGRALNIEAFTAEELLEALPCRA
jgi:hypothetical protein